MQNSDFMTRITSLYGSQVSSVILACKTETLDQRFKSLRVQTSPVILCMQNSVPSIRITSLYRSLPSSVVFPCKTATFGPELQVSMGPRPHLWIYANKTVCLAPNNNSLWVPDHICGFVHSQQRL